MADFRDSAEMHRRLYMRRIIKNADSEILTPKQIKILTKLVNLWLNKGQKTGKIHPGLKMLHKYADCDERTARRAMRRLEEYRFIIAVGYETGGKRKATEYKVDTLRIMQILDPSRVAHLPGELVPVSRYAEGKGGTKGDIQNGQCPPLGGAKCPPVEEVYNEMTLQDFERYFGDGTETTADDDDD